MQGNTVEFIKEPDRQDRQTPDTTEDTCMHMKERKGTNIAVSNSINYILIMSNLNMYV